MKSPRTPDELFEAYVAWREASAAVRVAYRAWACAKLADREVAFGGYLAALQQEGHAAGIYEECTERERGRIAAQFA